LLDGGLFLQPAPISTCTSSAAMQRIGSDIFEKLWLSSSHVRMVAGGVQRCSKKLIGIGAPAHKTTRVVQ
jgi:hypothetical protein